MEGDQVGHETHLVGGGALELCLQLLLEAPLVGELVLVEALNEAGEVASGPELLLGKENRAVFDQAVRAHAVNDDVDGRSVSVSEERHARTL